MRLRGAFVILFALAAAGAAGCSAAPRQRPVKGGDVDTGAGTLASARKYLEGRWTLESFQIYPPGKGPIALNGSGTLVYDDRSNLRMEIRLSLIHI